MKNNDKSFKLTPFGFTLIELLAVIIILAIVALIATPIILDVIGDARKSTGLSEANMIYSEINNYCTSEKLSSQLNNSELVCINDKIKDNISKMVNLGNAEILEIEYNDKLTWLKIKSNGNIYSLQDNKMVEGDLEKPIKPNDPELLDNMLPIKYDGTNWIVASEVEEWYNYDNKEWANAVVLEDGVSKNVGDTVSESEIALWYVWIPRYKYQLFNANNGSVPEQEIQITFESGTATTGTVKCTDIDFKENPTSEVSEICTNAENGAWYTHPAFTFGSQNLTGFWVGKFEVSGTTDKITIKPNVTSLRSQTISSFFIAIQNINTIYNINSDSHMMKNMEWGAVAYLTQSQYGRCNDGICTEVTINSNSDFYTGGGVSNVYKTNIAQSTTGNTYGIYDMSGGAVERTMANMVDSSGNFYPSSSEFTSALDSKYYDRYTYSTSNTTHGRGKLGDATKETLKTFGSDTGGWYSDYVIFPYSSYSWLSRGGGYSQGTDAGVFRFSNGLGVASSSVSARAVLCIK